MNFLCWMNLARLWQYCISSYHQSTDSTVEPPPATYKSSVNRKGMWQERWPILYDLPPRAWSCSFSWNHRAGWAWWRPGQDQRGRARASLKYWGCRRGNLQALFHFMTIHPQKFITSYILTSNSGPPELLATCTMNYMQKHTGQR